MVYRSLGKTGLEVSTIGFGCMSLNIHDEKESTRIIHHAVESGINLFDTADLYDKGLNEHLVGKALGPYREKIILATKAGNQWRADGSAWDWNPSKAYIIQAAENSLRRLQTDRIDLYQLHGGTIDDPIDDTISAFELLKQQGKILHYGISSIRPNVINEYVKRSAIVSVMMQYNIADRRPEEQILDMLAQHNIPVLVRGALAQGLLVDKPIKSYLDKSVKEMEKIRQAISVLSTEQRDAAAVATQYVLHHPAVASAITGIRTMKQLEDALKKSVPLSNQDYLFLQQASTPSRYEQHRIDH